MITGQEKQLKEGRWSNEEHENFLKGLKIYGKGKGLNQLFSIILEWKKIATLISSRSIVQVRTHAQKFFQKVARTNFEKHGREVPDALKSTAIKSSYNFESLQKALSENNLNQDSSRLKKFKTAESMPEREFSEETVLSFKPNKMNRKGSARTRRKSSRFSVDLQKLAISEAEDPNINETYNFIKPETQFIKSEDYFSEASELQKVLDLGPSPNLFLYDDSESALSLSETLENDFDPLTEFVNSELYSNAVLTETSFMR